MSLSVIMCFYCERNDLKKHLRVGIEKMDAKTSRKITAVSCMKCSGNAKLQVMMFTLSSISGIPFKKFKNYPCLTEYFKAFPETTDSEKEGIVIGLFDRYKCKICDKFLKLFQTVEEHNTERHSNEKMEKIAKCTSGCNEHYYKSDIVSHKDECSILCPVCKKRFKADTEHIENKHPSSVKMCPFRGCAIAFRIKKNEQEDDEDGINEYLKHIITYHVWKTDRPLKIFHCK